MCKTVSLSNELEGFTMLHSSSANETPSLLAKLTQAIERLYAGRRAQPGAGGGDGGDESSAASDAEPLMQFNDWQVMLHKMKSSKTVKDVWGLMLCSLQGGCTHISQGIAQCCVQGYCL